MASPRPPGCCAASRVLAAHILACVVVSVTSNRPPRAGPSLQDAFPAVRAGRPLPSGQRGLRVTAWPQQEAGAGPGTRPRGSDTRAVCMAALVVTGVLTVMRSVCSQRLCFPCGSGSCTQEKRCEVSPSPFSPPPGPRGSPTPSPCLHPSGKRRERCWVALLAP